MKMRDSLKTSSLGDRLIRRTPGLYEWLRSRIGESEESGRTERQAFRDRMTARTLNWAADTPYARARGLSGHYEAWPILNKQTLRDEGTKLVRRTVLPCNFAETSGSTGVPLSVVRSFASVVFEQAILDHLVEVRGNLDWRSARIAVLRADNIKNPSDFTPPFWRLQHGGRYLAMSSNHLTRNTVGAYLDTVKAFNPDMLWVYPSTLEVLCRLAEQRDIQIPGLKLILSSSEVLSTELREEVRRRARVPVLDYYGLGERTCMSWALDAHNHVFMPIYGRVELNYAYEDSDSAYYELYGTSYWNSAQPLVRYATGDLARLPKALSSDAVEEIELGLRPFLGIVGRQSDYLETPGGNRSIGINHIPRGVENVAQMQFIQTGPSSVDICVVPLTGYSRSTADHILRNARIKIPESVDVNIVVVDQVRRTARGKAPLVIREFRQ